MWQAAVLKEDSVHVVHVRVCLGRSRATIQLNLASWRSKEDSENRGYGRRDGVLFVPLESQQQIGVRVHDRIE